MPLITSAPDALPYIDAKPSDAALSAANALVQSEMDPEHATTLHPSIPTMREAQFSDLVEQEYARIGSGQAKEPGTGIDLSRYEALDAPARGDLPAWKTTLQQAYTSAEYLRGRGVNLGLLETYGKNAWLISNARLEDELKALEREVEAAKLELEAVEQGRRAMQSNVAGELQGLEETWRKGVGRMVEAQAAAERIRAPLFPTTNIFAQELGDMMNTGHECNLDPGEMHDSPSGSVGRNRRRSLTIVI
ncbi:hypothetical protein D0859_09117 [Hortaea werneckii]|uniref:Pre-mRNA-splicing factor SPF27 n=1 Tax=Hortaea werneckii TaxID=91943 RepID=A0A3M7IMP8_HORWE|nr:hypothetical protein D0859_09117 [Hortaea werneckii]